MENEIDVRGVAINFEAVKIAFTQDKNGFVLKLSLHPNDAPESVMMDALGTRYMVALVRLSDDGVPVASPSDEEGKRAFGLDHAAQRPAGTYSGGMARRLDLAGALVARPPVVVLDEPTTGSIRAPGSTCGA